MSPVYHYTLGTGLMGIIADGQIGPAFMNVDAVTSPAVWFSRRATWEPTASKRYLSAHEDRAATIPEMVAKGGALVRLEVAAGTARHGWAYHAKWHERSAMAKALARGARDVGADPMEWSVCYGPVPVSRVVRVEYSDDGATWHGLGRFEADGSFGCVAPDVFGRITASLGEGR